MYGSLIEVSVYFLSLWSPAHIICCLWVTRLSARTETCCEAVCLSICHFVSLSLAHCSFTLIIWTSLSRCHFCYKSLICPSAMTFFSSIMSWQHRDRHFFQVLTSHFPLSVTKQNIHVLPRLGCLSCSDKSPLSSSQASLKTFPVLPTLCSDSKASHSIRASSLIHRGLVCLPALTHF